MILTLIIFICSLISLTLGAILWYIALREWQENRKADKQYNINKEADENGRE